MDVKQDIKWDDILNKTVLDWKNIYLTPIKSTIDTILRNFQYKFLMQIIPTNSFLLKCKIVNTNLCDFCNRNIETVKHLFWECHYSQHFWSQLKTFLLGIGIYFELKYKFICFGKRKQQILNFIIISAKYFIFRNKYTKTIPNFIEYKSFLYRRIEIEKCIALDKDKLEQHIKKWRAFC